MQVKGKERMKFTGKIGVAGALLLATGFVANYATATVTGRCDMCHTMHNSQSGAAQATTSGAHWTGNSGTYTSPSGGSVSTEQSQLLKTDCVGCHSNTGTETIVTIAGNKIPIVYNTGAYPTASVLAGGNFNMVAAGNNGYGHNVLGIAPADPVLSKAPGDSLGCGQSCHSSLALTDAAINPASTLKHGGCQGCHNKVGHHNPADDSYRYLGGHVSVGTNKVDGGGPPASPGLPNPYEDQSGKWEQGATATTVDHNFYKAAYTSHDYGTMALFCTGCHSEFHAMGADINDSTANINGGGSSDASLPNPWMRHPNSVNIPNSGEYAAVFGKTYNPLVPVARVDGETSATIVAGDQVFCLSCHRAHASDQPDSLRFPYSGMIAHVPNAATDGTGCFFCHTTKDNS